MPYNLDVNSLKHDAYNIDMPVSSIEDLKNNLATALTATLWNLGFADKFQFPGQITSLETPTPNSLPVASKAHFSHSSEALDKKLRNLGDPAFEQAVIDVANRMGISTVDLLFVLNGESGGSNFSTRDTSSAGYVGVAQLRSDNRVFTSGLADWQAYRSMDRAGQLLVAEKEWRAWGYQNYMGMDGISIIQAAPALLKHFDDNNFVLGKYGGVDYGIGGNAWVANPHWRVIDNDPHSPITIGSIKAYYRRSRGG